MTAPDPTAGEHDHEWTRCSACRTDGPCPCSGGACALCPASAPAVAASTAGEREDPTYCWADPDNGHKWEARGVCNDSGIPLDFICRWCTREISEIPPTAAASTGTSEDVEALVELLGEHEGCVANAGQDNTGSGSTGVDVWSCGIRVPFVDDLDVMERAHTAAAISSLLDARRRQIAEAVTQAVTEHADHMETYTLPALAPGFIDGWTHALRLLRRDAGVIADRARRIAREAGTR